MSDLNDNNIDEAYKQAAEKYPLRTDSADWDRMAADLDRDPSLILPPVPGNGARRRYGRWFWLLLLLPLAMVGYYLWHQQEGKVPVAGGVVKEGGKSGAKTGDGNTGIKNDVKGTGGENDAVARDADNVSGYGASGKRDDAGGNSVGTDGRKGNGVAGKNAGLQNAADPGYREVSGGPNSIAGRKNRKDTGMSDAGVDERPGLGITDRASRINRTGSAGGGSRAETREAEGSLLTLKPVGLSRGFALNVPPPSWKKPVAAPDSTGQKKKKVSGRKASFYAGILGAPDLSMVKYQSVKGTGFNIGILLGYNINRKWAVETGVYLDRKKYYTDGEYFNAKNIYLQPGYKLLNADGSCNMVEVPVNLRYNLNPDSKTKWFGTAGLSTYFMTRESYAYGWTDGTWNGNGFATYKKPSQYWFSVINLSFGLEQRLGKGGSLRIEPYWRIPTRGMGTGSLPIMSTGLNIGYTHKLW